MWVVTVLNVVLSRRIAINHSVVQAKRSQYTIISLEIVFTPQKLYKIECIFYYSITGKCEYC